MKRITIITKYYSPSTTIDAVSVNRLVYLLREQCPNIHVTVITTSSGYGKGGRYSVVELDKFSGVNVKSINFPWKNLKNDFLKFVTGLVEGLVIIVRSLRVRSDLIITLSNPPCINLWSALLLKGRNWCYWCFDLYPDALFAANCSKNQGFIRRVIERVFYYNSPKLVCALGVNQLDYIRKMYRSKNLQGIILPCGIHETQSLEDRPLWASNEKIIIGYVGNVGRAHSSEFLLNVIRSAIQRPDIVMVLSIYGYHSKAILDEVKLMAAINIIIIPNVKQSELSWIDVHLVSLKPDWTHVSVPSKAVSAVCAGSALWFCGSKQSDTYTGFACCSYYSFEDMGAVSILLDTLSRESVNFKKSEAVKCRDQLLKCEKASVIKIVEGLG